MEIDELLRYRTDLLNESKDEEGFIDESAFLSKCMYMLNEAKITDSEDYENVYDKNESLQTKINGYLRNESEERLQIFVVNDQSISLSINESDLKISQKSYYEKYFNMGQKFADHALKGYFNKGAQDSSPILPLCTFLSSGEGTNQIDVIEIIVLSATATIETRGSYPHPKNLEFEDSVVKGTYAKNRETIKKEITVLKRLIDLNFLHRVLTSQGGRYPLTIDFRNNMSREVEVLKAADEEKFESYLCVFPAEVLANLYLRYSNRLLEKNVRSFLQFKNSANAGMLKTIKEAPEKFIAFNNGLTITATGIQLYTSGRHQFIESLLDFQIVNGGQTTAAIFFAKKDGYNISRVNVMAKITIAKSMDEDQLNELIKNISLFSNTQSKVSKVDLDSRSAQLVKIKSLSESIITPNGKKWFFERAKGEFSTMLRKSPRNKDRIIKEFPTERRFSKEQLGKYYMAWGAQPHIIKKGGEKVFRLFIEEIAPGGNSKKGIEIDREFFEDAVSRIIIFRDLETIYGQGPKSMGQIRSAVIPYSMATLYLFTTGQGTKTAFNMSRIWKQGHLEEDLGIFFSDLMRLMNALIKKYSKSDDLGEYSKKEELWKDIRESKEIQNFMKSQAVDTLLKKYCTPQGKRKKKPEVDFSRISQIARIYDNTSEYYKQIIRLTEADLSNADKYKLEEIFYFIREYTDVSDAILDFEIQLTDKLRTTNPEVFDKIEVVNELIYSSILDLVIKNYNEACDAGESFESRFNLIREKAKLRNADYSSVFTEIGKQLDRGIAPTVKQLFYASHFIKAK